MARITGKKRHSIRKSQATALYALLGEEIGASAGLFWSERVERLETSAGTVLYLIDKKPNLMERDGWVFPTLKGLLEHPFPERRVVVDSGAVPFVVNGADIMRPGTVTVSSDIQAQRPVQVVEERHGKPIAVGIALFDSAGLLAKTSGKVVKTIHYIGDDLWNLEF
ncbi:MAG TPA: RNA-binding protein [Methanoregulaceae archaeon]|nr:MAG: RNA-binding protein [Methanolinea sp.]HON80770.1 RNA-binding protein [Methanoregulaceae archaeon]HPD09505.1 RNA-binding protein [Methanoregulaceae archaeon]HRT14703.1 RNA-binding protein [Methanoregulaceae archaeon]HRU30276.1 RNA-binding protein [Methanoregulaceae archaeon]